jgi:hypothetical protein
MTLIKLHRNGLKVTPDLCKYSHWNLASMGSLIYTHDTKGQIANAFRGNEGSGFTISDTPTGQGASDRFLVVFGKYEGKSEQFEGMNLLHQRNAMLGNHGQTGIAAIDAVFGVASKIANYPETIARAMVNPKKKYFVGFFNESKHQHMTRFMHNQGSVCAVYMDGPATLAQIFHKHKNFFFAKV